MRVADVLRDEFRASDMVCRLKADEFAVIMARAISEHKELIEGKMEAITAALSKEKDGVAPVKVSFGVAFGDENAEGDIFTAADFSLKGDR